MHELHHISSLLQSTGDALVTTVFSSTLPWHASFSNPGNGSSVGIRLLSRVWSLVAAEVVLSPSPAGPRRLQRRGNWAALRLQCCQKRRKQQWWWGFLILLLPCSFSSPTQDGRGGRTSSTAPAWSQEPPKQKNGAVVSSQSCQNRRQQHTCCDPLLLPSWVDFMWHPSWPQTWGGLPLLCHWVVVPICLLDNMFPGGHLDYDQQWISSQYSHWSQGQVEWKYLATATTFCTNCTF